MDGYCSQALAEYTQRSYNSAKRRYAQFCTSYSMPPLPLREETLCRYVAHLANEGVSHSSAKRYLAALRHLQVEQELGDPQISTMPKLDPVLRGVKRAQSWMSKPKARLPIAPELLQKNEGGLAWRRRGSGWPNALGSLYSLFFRLYEVWRNHHTVGLLLGQHGSPHLHRRVNGLSGIPQNVESPPEAVKDGPIQTWSGCCGGEDWGSTMPSGGSTEVLDHKR